jgi:hypothetical protein
LTGCSRAKIAFSQNKTAPPEGDKKDLTIDIEAKFNKIKKDLAAENEVAVSVTWTGGGQRLKARKCAPLLPLIIELTDLKSSRARLGF